MLEMLLVAVLAGVFVVTAASATYRERTPSDSAKHFRDRSHPRKPDDPDHRI